MAILICMDGLAGCPGMTFGGLEKILTKNGHSVILVDVEGIQTHDDRIKKVLSCYEHVRTNFPGEKIFLLGQSAGGSAVRIAAESLEGLNQPDGVILMSPAMPRFIWYGTPVLMKIMMKRLWQIICGKTLNSTDAEARKLLSPMSKDVCDAALFAREPIPGKEARELAFYPRPFKGVTCPVLLVYGDKDQWIAPSAQKKLHKMLLKKASCVTEFVAHGAGHVTLFSESHKDVSLCIAKWINLQCCSKS